MPEDKQEVCPKCGNKTFYIYNKGYTNMRIVCRRCGYSEPYQE